jgi:hypothetical protein
MLLYGIRRSSHRFDGDPLGVLRASLVFAAGHTILLLNDEGGF